MCGDASRHGSHHVAQKSRSTGLPRKLTSVTSWLSTPDRVKSGAGLPRRSVSEGGVNDPAGNMRFGADDDPSVSATGDNRAKRSLHSFSAFTASGSFIVCLSTSQSAALGTGLRKGRIGGGAVPCDRLPQLVPEVAEALAGIPAGIEPFPKSLSRCTTAGVSVPL